MRGIISIRSIYQIMPKTSERPGNRPSVFLNFMFIVIFVLLKTWHLFATCLYHGGVFWRFISMGIYDTSLFHCSGSSKMHVEHPQKILCFLDCFALRHAILSHHINLRTVFAVNITHISISTCASPLPSLDICHEHWTLARQATWQHLFTGLPATIYCTSVGKYLWAASLDTAHSLC